MSLASPARAGRFDQPFLTELGHEPPIDANPRRHAPFDRRALSIRWLCGTVLTGICGAALLGSAIIAAFDRQGPVVQQPEYAAAPVRDTASDGDEMPKGDRLVRAADIVAEKQDFQAPVTQTVGDKQIVRNRDFTRISTTLTTVPTGLAAQVPEFNPLKLLNGDATNAPDATLDPGPAFDESDTTFTIHDLSTADPSAFSGTLSKDEIRAQVNDFVSSSANSLKQPVVLPPQMMLMRTSRATLKSLGGLPYAAAESMTSAPFSQIAVKMVPENVSIVPQTSRLHEGVHDEERLVVLHQGETLETLLRRNGATAAQAQAIVSAFSARRGTAPVADGRRIRLLLTAVDGHGPLQIARVSVYADETLETTIALEDGGGYVQVAHVEANPKALRANRPKANDDSDDDADQGGMPLYQSLYETALKQQIPKAIIDNLVRVFSDDVDFQRGVAAGDTFDAFYSDEDEASRDDLLFASITVRGETFRFYRFQTPDDGSVDYFDENGQSTRKFLIRKPVPVGEVTSGFGVRFHPILGYTRPHTGVDWGAPIGTPILASGNGTILTVERNSSYGNHIEIQHPNGYVTTYSHMSGFARGITAGMRVRQGQVIGYLGQTGLATGPHLHYEVIVNGHFVDPMRVKLARTRDMDGAMLASFKREHDRINALMASAPNPMPDVGPRAAN